LDSGTISDDKARNSEVENANCLGDLALGHHVIGKMFFSKTKVVETNAFPLLLAYMTKIKIKYNSVGYLYMLN